MVEPEIPCHFVIQMQFSAQKPGNVKPHPAEPPKGEKRKKEKVLVSGASAHRTNSAWDQGQGLSGHLNRDKKLGTDFFFKKKKERNTPCPQLGMPMASQQCCMLLFLC